MDIEKDFCISLDSIIRDAFNNTDSLTQAFISTNEKPVMEHLREYTRKAAGQGSKDVPAILEQYGDNLLDSICASNKSYFQAGMRSGALLLLQLLT